jgi:hypothetical protein
MARYIYVRAKIGRFISPSLQITMEAAGEFPQRDEANTYDVDEIDLWIAQANVRLSPDQVAAHVKAKYPWIA